MTLQSLNDDFSTTWNQLWSSLYGPLDDGDLNNRTSIRYYLLHSYAVSPITVGHWGVAAHTHLKNCLRVQNLNNKVLLDKVMANARDVATVKEQIVVFESRIVAVERGTNTVGERVDALAGRVDGVAGELQQAQNRITALERLREEDVAKITALEEANRRDKEESETKFAEKDREIAELKRKNEELEVWKREFEERMMRLFEEKTNEIETVREEGSTARNQLDGRIRHLEGEGNAVRRLASAMRRHNEDDED